MVRQRKLSSSKKDDAKSIAATGEQLLVRARRY